MTTPGLVLSCFPGIGLLDMAFEQEGYCVVRGPDVLWGGDIRRFHPPAGVFEGVIGGPPCKGESKLAHLNGHPGRSLADEFARVVAEAQPTWWVMEAVVRHEAPYVLTLNPRWLGELQSRRRYFHSNVDLAPYIEVALWEPSEFKHAVLAGHGGARGTVKKGMAKYEWREACRLQGLPDDFDLPGFTYSARYEALGNGVPLVLGKAVARCITRVMQDRSEADR